MRHSHTRLTAVVVVLTLAFLAGGQGAAAADRSDRPAAKGAGGVEGWQWPLEGFRLVLPYQAPAHRYGPGHRGVDLRPNGDDAVRAPAAGVVAFSGTVVDRDVVTIDHGGGLVSTLEPVVDAVPAGTPLGPGDPVARLGFGGHTPPGVLHFGVRLQGEYINPGLLLGAVQRAVLLPCC